MKFGLKIARTSCKKVVLRISVFRNRSSTMAFNVTHISKFLTTKFDRETAKQPIRISIELQTHEEGFEE